MSSALGYGNVTGRFFILEVAGCIGTIPVSAPRNSVIAKPSLPVRKLFHGVAVYF